MSHPRSTYLGTLRKRRETDKVNGLQRNMSNLRRDPRGCVWWKSKVQCGAERE